MAKNRTRPGRQKSALGRTGSPRRISRDGNIAEHRPCA